MTPTVFDVGMHTGEDTNFYLHKGFRVIGIDANPEMIERAKRLFAKECATGQFVPVHCAISLETGPVTVHISEKSFWTSLNQSISTRMGLAAHTVSVPSRTLAEITAEYGVPQYIKIDVEGYDAVAIKSLRGSNLPEYISAEAECADETSGKLSDDDAAEVLNTLYSAGYRRFKLVEQDSLTVLRKDRQFFDPKPRSRFTKKFMKLTHIRSRDHFWACVRHLMFFRRGASGPFGRDLTGERLTHEDALATLSRHRADYFSLPDTAPWGFWCDWHAMK